MFPGNTYQERYTITEEGSLHIKGIIRKDEGHYVCSAISQAGASTATVFLQVTSTEEIPPPIIELGPANQTLLLKSTATMPCRAVGTPNPKVNWHKDGALVKLGSRITMASNGTLFIEDRSFLFSKKREIKNRKKNCAKKKLLNTERENNQL